MSNTIKLNEKTLTQEEFEEAKKKLDAQKVKLVEVAPNEFKTKLEG